MFKCVVLALLQIVEARLHTTFRLLHFVLLVVRDDLLRRKVRHVCHAGSLSDADASCEVANKQLNLFVSRLSE